MNLYYATKGVREVTQKMRTRTQIRRRLLDAGYIVAAIGAGAALCINMIADRVRAALPTPRNAGWNQLSAAAGIAFLVAMCGAITLAVAAELVRRSSNR